LGKGRRRKSVGKGNRFATKEYPVGGKDGWHVPTFTQKSEKSKRGGRVQLGVTSSQEAMKPLKSGREGTKGNFLWVKTNKATEKI